MSFDYTAWMVVGVPLTDVYGETVETTQVQKYDENTGQPYLRPVRMLRKLFCGKPVDDKYAACSPEEIIETLTPLRVFSPHAESAITDRLVGLKLRGHTLDRGLPNPVTVAELTQTCVRVRAMLLDQGFDGEPQLYLMQHGG